MSKTAALVWALTLAGLVGCADGGKPPTSADTMKCAPIPCPPARPWSPDTCRCESPSDLCNDLQKTASDTISGAVASVVQCTTNADCRQFVSYGPFECVDCVQVVGNANVTNAIAAKAASVNQTCAAFKAAGCQLVPSGCPPLALDAITCQQGTCVHSP